MEAPPADAAADATTEALLLPVLPDETIFEILSHFDVRTLIEKKVICKNWQQICTNVINAKRTTTSGTKRIFQTNRELRIAVRKYVGLYDRNPDGEEEEFFLNSFSYCDPMDAEEFATTYGWPIGNWDVSNLTDLSYVFRDVSTFNEDINDWDVSNVTTMDHMFHGAHMFDQNISSWNTSQVTSMNCMFLNATQFNQDISNWDTSNVTTMARMFSWATTFDQDLSSWDTSNVISMAWMFGTATSFNHDVLSTWNTMNVRYNQGMFAGATAYNNNQQQQRHNNENKNE